MKDLFSVQSSQYVQFRPDYPSSLFDYILSHVPHKKTAWDVGTGNGQCAAVLSQYFEKIIATDISSKQLEQAIQAPNIFYSLQSAEHTNIEAGSINLVTIAQALHWFDFEKFYAEVKRVAAPGAVIAAWCYSLLSIDDAINPLIEEFHFSTLEQYWDKERKLVDDGYTSIPFPFAPISSPQFCIEKQWTLAGLEGYLCTWSAVQKFIKANAYNPVPELINRIAPLWKNDECRKIIFPLHLLLGTINE